MDELQSLLDCPPKGAVEGLFASIDELVMDDGNTVIREETIPHRFDVVKLLESLRGLEWPSRGQSNGDVNAHCMNILRLAFDLGRLRELNYTIPQGEDVLVHPEDGTAITQYAFAPPDPLTLQCAAWRNWTRLAWGAGPWVDEALVRQYQHSIAEDEPATIYAVARNRIEAIPFLAYQLRQILSMYSRSTHDVLKGIPQGTGQDLYTILDTVVNEAGGGALLPYRPDASIAKVPSDIVFQYLFRKQLGEAFKLIQGGQQECSVLPVMVPLTGEFLCLPSIAWLLRMVLPTYVNGITDEDLSKLLGDQFELLLATLLEEHGYSVRLNGETALRASINPRGEEDIDVLAWSGSVLFAIEAKAKMEPPGAWREAAVDDHRDELGSLQTDIHHKSGELKDEITSNLPKIYLDGVEVEDVTPIQGKVIQPIVVSIRVDPRVNQDEVPVISYMPPDAIELAQEKLPTSKLCPLWDGQSDLPAPLED